jgi:endonuclease G
MKNLFPILITFAIIYFLITPTNPKQNKPLPSPPNKTIINQPVLDDYTTVEKPDTYNESDIVFGSYPKPKAYQNEITVLNRGAFVIGYDEIKKCPVWVAYKVTPDDDYISPKRPSHFEVDYATKSKVRPDDYTRSGYDRGHLAPNYAIGSRYGRVAQLETFKMSNIAPQKAGLNRGYWKDVEELESKKGEYSDRFEEIWVICGCIWDSDKTFVGGKVEIPDYFYKIIIDVLDGKPRVMGFIFPQVPPKKYLKSYLKSVD